MFYLVKDEVTFYTIFGEYLAAIGSNVKIGACWLSPKQKFNEVYDKNGNVCGSTGFKNLPIGQNGFNMYLKEIARECGLSDKITLKTLRDTVLSSWSHSRFSNEMGVVLKILKFFG